MWARRYDGAVQAIILVKYTCRNPRFNPASFLLLFRPVLRSDGKWTVAQDGPTYTLFPRPVGVVEGDFNQPHDALPLVYQDYFGPGNVQAGTGPNARFDLSLELVRRYISEAIQAENNRRQYRYVSGGSSVGSHGQPEEQDPVEQEEHRQIPVVDENDQFGGDWEDPMSDVSDE